MQIVVTPAKAEAQEKSMTKNTNEQIKYIPLEDFFKNPEITQVRISPNGKYLAYLKPFQKRLNIHIKPVDGKEPERRLTNQIDRDIAAFFWKEDDTLLFLRDFGGDENFHFFRISAQGEGEKDLTPYEDTKVQLISSLENISEDHIIIGTNQRDKKVFDAYRLNVKTGETEKIAENPGYFIDWLVDHQGKLRVATATDGANTTLYYREEEQKEFEKIFTKDFKDTMSPGFFTFDDKNIYVFSNLDQDTTAIEIFDPRQKKIISTLFKHPEVDIRGLNYSKKRKVLTSARYTTWKNQIHFFDLETEQIFKDIKSQISEEEITIGSKNRDEDLWVLRTYSDRNPGAYYLYDTKNKNLQKIAEEKPWINVEDMAEMQPISYKARDGLLIHGYLTLPKNYVEGKKCPVIVHPHGGPWARDIWCYNPIVQFLTNRGYAVLQMNFRGSTGYGKKFWTAGFKQWGRKMQDDVTDGVQYLIEKGIVDKDKVGIYGGSYGGYVVLAGLCFTPDLYACGVDYVGVSNMFTTLANIPPYWEPYREMMYEMDGHPEKDKEFLKSISPVFHADKIKAPLFVAQGAKDPRVKKAESDQIVEALKKRGVDVLYMVKENEGHGFRNEENKMEFYSAMEKFFAEYLKP